MSRRDDVMMHNEGQLLTFAAMHTENLAAEQARGMIDGAFNALSRFEGSLEASEFAFAVADRMVGRIKASTPCPPKGEKTFALPPPPPAAPVKAEPRRYGFWTILAIGWALGVMTVVGISDPGCQFFAWLVR